MPLVPEDFKTKGDAIRADPEVCTAIIVLYLPITCLLLGAYLRALACRAVPSSIMQTESAAAVLLA